MKHGFYALMLSIGAASCASGEVGAPSPSPEPDPGQSTEPTQPGPPSLPAHDSTGANGDPSDPLPPDDPIHRQHTEPHAGPVQPM